MIDSGSADVVVIGGGPAGLAVAATLKRRGIEAVVLERAAVGESWRNHYERLHLHTVRWLSNLPGLRIDRREGRWVPRDGVVRYLERYAKHHALDVRTGVVVTGLERGGDRWRLTTSRGELFAGVVVIATGHNREPALPDWPGAAGFSGELLHSTEYRNPKPYAGKDVLVVGTGNSGAEIAVDLVEGGAATVMISVRTPPNILRRDLAGFPSQVTGVLFRRMPVKFVDRASALMQRAQFGDLSEYGLPAPAGGLLTRVGRDQVPILDIGLIKLVKRRRVEVVPA
ncbi:MAG: NAD(P)/FAD-dependent oxidoreductase, partial [Actinobacteria bacterium]|nr:NAD(P)/FAD-dependent oxidoreductase [Actinomycetota bacterium]